MPLQSPRYMVVSTDYLNTINVYYRLIPLGVTTYIVVVTWLEAGATLLRFMLVGIEFKVRSYPRGRSYGKKSQLVVVWDSMFRCFPR